MKSNDDVSSSPVNGGGPSYSSLEREMVREQLDRILASFLFRNSKRLQDFLRYTVEHALSGETESVKERTLGVEVFGRDPNYDRSVDPVVRVTAGELRKRISQYYQTRGHETELRIEFERGSYIPGFVFPDELALREEAQPSEPPPTVESKKISKWVMTTLIVAPYVAFGIFLLGGTRQTALDRFWNPVVGAKNAAIVCIPSQEELIPAIQPATAPSAVKMIVSPLTAAAAVKVSMGDSRALAMVSRVLGSKGKEFHVRSSNSVSLDDLKYGPAILIGGFENQWTMRLGNELRFKFAHTDSIYYISDSQNASSRSWSTPDDPTLPPESVDYGLISRVVDHTTGRATVTVGGFHHFELLRRRSASLT